MRNHWKGQDFPYWAQKDLVGELKWVKRYRPTTNVHYIAHEWIGWASGGEAKKKKKKDLQVTKIMSATIFRVQRSKFYTCVMAPGLHAAPSLISPRVVGLRRPDSSERTCRPWLEPDWRGGLPSSTFGSALQSQPRASLVRHAFPRLCPAISAWNLIGAAYCAPIHCSAAIRGKGTTKSRHQTSQEGLPNHFLENAMLVFVYLFCVIKHFLVSVPY